MYRRLNEEKMFHLKYNQTFKVKKKKNFKAITSLALCTASLGGFLICGEDFVFILS